MHLCISNALRASGRVLPGQTWRNNWQRVRWSKKDPVAVTNIPGSIVTTMPGASLRVWPGATLFPILPSMAKLLTGGPRRLCLAM